MQIVIIGCGKVGKTLVAQLVAENHNITVIDTNPEVVEDITELYDVLGIVGNGTSNQILQSADIEHTDVLIAVTDRDEVNLLCCAIAKQKSACHTIARVRNPIYSAERHFLRHELQLSLTINPEQEAAREIARLLQFPNAVEIDSFAQDRIDMLRFRIMKNSPLEGKALRDLSPILGGNILVCMAGTENGSVVIPDGNYVVKVGDTLTIIAMPGEAEKFFNRIGITTNRAKNTIIIGGGGISYYLTEFLLKMGTEVKIIEQNKARCEELNELFPSAVIDCGDGSSQELLNAEHLETMDSLVACTGIDEVNAILSLYARKKVRKKVVTKLNHVEFDDVIDSLDLDSVVNPRKLTAQKILQYIRAMNNSMGSNVETLYRLMNGKVEALAFIIQKASPVTGVRLADLRTKQNTLIAGIIRGGRLIIPGGQDTIEVGDSVIVVTTNLGFVDISDILD